MNALIKTVGFLCITGLVVGCQTTGEDQDLATESQVSASQDSQLSSEQLAEQELLRSQRFNQLEKDLNDVETRGAEYLDAISDLHAHLLECGDDLNALDRDGLNQSLTTAQERYLLLVESFAKLKQDTKELDRDGLLSMIEMGEYDDFSSIDEVLATLDKYQIGKKEAASVDRAMALVTFGLANQKSWPQSVDQAHNDSEKVLAAIKEVSNDLILVSSSLTVRMTEYQLAQTNAALVLPVGH